MNSKFVKFTAATIFGLVAIAHLIRVIFNIPIIIGSSNVSVWVSIVAVIITGSLSVLLIKKD